MTVEDTDNNGSELINLDGSNSPTAMEIFLVSPGTTTAINSRIRFG
jgi:hypothetical protein